MSQWLARRVPDGRGLCPAGRPKHLYECSSCGSTGPAHAITNRGLTWETCYRRPQRRCGAYGGPDCPDLPSRHRGHAGSVRRMLHRRAGRVLGLRPGPALPARSRHLKPCLRQLPSHAAVALRVLRSVRRDPGDLAPGACLQGPLSQTPGPAGGLRRLCRQRSPDREERRRCAYLWALPGNRLRVPLQDMPSGRSAATRPASAADAC
jgi:hypothetical protein